jgi:hypothetical protein
VKIFFVLVISIIIFAGCGKKSNPEYKSKINKINISVS